MTDINEYVKVFLSVIILIISIKFLIYETKHLKELKNERRE